LGFIIPGYVYLTYRFMAGDKDMSGSRLQYISQYDPNNQMSLLSSRVFLSVLVFTGHRSVIGSDHLVLDYYSTPSPLSILSVLIVPPWFSFFNQQGLAFEC
jgi:hypothetical protein